MTKVEVLARLQSVFDAVFLTRVHVTPELRAADVEEWDSMAQITLVAAVEKAFGVRFRTGEVEKVANVGGLADLVLAHLALP